ncbi:unnamed protein product [Owenia fusiformis]|uniref:Uncharacterized protein n=1 Tax=Owenia fusiformis TaxID=6347 RepID=A0A8J1V257_OWEFU|nr:unnamed protein product [Owenia fusiformis]
MMELDSLGNVVVATLDEKKAPISIVVKQKDGKCSAEEVFKKACKALGLKEKSTKYFTLLQGSAYPIKKFNHTDEIDCKIKDLTIQKWCFDQAAEKSLLTKDEIALHLVFIQAQNAIKKGFLKCTSEQTHKLEEFLDPSFHLENQYVALCQNLSLYNHAVISPCSLCVTLQTQNIKIDKDIKFTLLVGLKGLELCTDTQRYWVAWPNIKSWFREKKQESIGYQMQSNDGVVHLLHFATNQAPYLLAVTMEIIKVLQREQDEHIFMETSMVKKHDEVMTHWDNSLFNPDMTKNSVQSNNDSGAINLAHIDDIKAQ